MFVSRICHRSLSVLFPQFSLLLFLSLLDGVHAVFKKPLSLRRCLSVEAHFIFLIALHALLNVETGDRRMLTIHVADVLVLLIHKEFRFMVIFKYI